MNANWCKKYSKLLLTILLRTNKKLKKQKSQETPFHSSLFENWLNKFWFAIVIQKNNSWNLKQIFYLNQLQRIIIIEIWKSISQIHSFQSLGHQCTLKERRKFYKLYKEEKNKGTREMLLTLEQYRKKKIDCVICLFPRIWNSGI